ncbi:MAG: class B sortase [Oscillospiraceae bacterium]|nr:class B sortase [Oscillospiraceae bacterium]
MPELDIRRKYTYGQKRRKKQKENILVFVASGLFPWSGDSLSDKIRKVVFLVSVLALTVSVVLIINFYFGNHDADLNSGYFDVDNDCDNMITISIPGTAITGSNISNNSQEIKILEKYKKFYDDNSEFVGYLSIDSVIDYPVVQSQGDKSNDWYLNHDFNGEETKNGTIFADKFGEFTPTSRPHNTIIHGHNLMSKNKFQPLVNYRDSMTTEGFPFLKEHPLINFDTLYEPGVYKIFAVYQTHVTDIYGKFFDYWRRVYFPTKDDFYEYVVESLDRSHYYTGVDLKYGDEILTLSTCDFTILDKMRLIIVARRIRPGESTDMDTDAFISNRENGGKTETGFMKYKMSDAFYKMHNKNMGWGGRQWDISMVEGLDRAWLGEYDERAGFS